MEYVAEGASFSCDALPDIKDVDSYVAWMKGLANTTMPGCSYDLHSLTSSETTVVYFATFHGTHSGDGGPVPPTGKTTASRYVYVLEVNSDNKIKNMTKVWNAPAAFAQLGWA